MASPLVYAITHAPASEAYKQDRGAFVPVAHAIRAKTPYAIFGGLQVEEPNIVVVVGWDTLEAAAAGAELRAVARAPATHHVAFQHDPRAALSAPVTELLWLSPKPGVAGAALAAGLAALFAHLHAAAGPAGPYKYGGGTYGATLEAPDTFVVAMGWPTVEAHVAAAQARPLKDLAGVLMGVAEIKMVHAVLEAFRG